jgi:hypothetical protein
LAWIGMVLVHPDYRRRGIGRALLEHCLDFLQHRRIRCIKLDATPLGRPLYGQLGFQEEWSLARWQRDSNPIPSSLPSECASSRTRPPAANEFEELDKLDQTGFGVSRRDLLARLIASGSSLIQTSDSNALLGYACSRVGSKATYFGPATAGEATDGVTLVRELLTTITDGPCFWDIPDPNAPAIALAEELGFSRQRPLYRMYLGENKNPGVPTRMFAIADPAMG